MKSKNYTLLSLLCSIIFMFITTNLTAQDYFPLEVGNRWDYFVEGHVHGSPPWYDTLSIEIVGKETLSNGLEYFLFYNSFRWYSKYVREENNKIYFFDEVDSVDCFRFRFDIPQDSFYIDDCNGVQRYIRWIDTSFTLGYPDIHQNQNLHEDFSYNFGIYHLFEPGFFEYDYALKGCIISGVTYGNLLVSVGKEINPPNKFTLSQNYPNPFNPFTKIKYQIPELNFVTLKVYDVLGNEIATLVNEEKPAGSYEVEFNAMSLPSGIYFYQLRAGEFIQIKKMILLK